MTAFSFMFRGLMVFLAAANLGAQERAPLNLQTLLPTGAQIIETARLNAGKGKAGMLVLWMLNPKRVMRQGDSPCGGIVYVDYWYGPTRLSLVDFSKKTLINTIEIRPLYEATDEKDRGFPIPFYVSNFFYAVPKTDKDKEGVPKILSLRDMTGEGIAGQFVLFEFPYCGSPPKYSTRV